jgi:hypothetical protein
MVSISTGNRARVAWPLQPAWTWTLELARETLELAREPWLECWRASRLGLERASMRAEEAGSRGRYRARE